MKASLLISALLAPFVQQSLALTIAEINGNKFISSYAGKTVSNVEGLVTASSKNGVYVRSTKPDSDPATSESIYIYSSSIGSSVSVGDIINFGGRVDSYGSNLDYLPLLEIASPKNVKIVSSGNPVRAVTLGKSTTLIGSRSVSPPTQQYSSLDDGNVFATPNNQSQIRSSNPTLKPSDYGLDFWQSLLGELVTVSGPTVLGPGNSYGETWVVGDWTVTGRNARGGVTITPKDGNPEIIIIGQPLDGTKNPNNVKLGDKVSAITGVVSQAYGYYTILPTTAIQVTSSASPASAPVTRLVSNGKCNGLTIGDANIENFAPNSSRLHSIAEMIVTYLKSPDLVFLQEVQDDSGSSDNGVVSSNTTLNQIVSEISSQGGVAYEYAVINPQNDQDGGQPGGNIRVAYLFNPDVVQLVNPNPGSSTDANKVLPGPSLKYNPGRILADDNETFASTRKPLAAEWELVNGGQNFFTVNVQMSSKLGGSSLQGNPRTPVNGAVEKRYYQMKAVASFVKQITDEDSDAAVIVAGDFNEFSFVDPLTTFVQESGFVDFDEATSVSAVERYTYFYAGNDQELDHFFVSSSVAKAANSGDMDHVHRNTWVALADQASDHDPSVARVNVCGGAASARRSRRRRFAV